MTLKDRVLEYVSANSDRNSNEIANALGELLKSVSASLSTLVAEKKVGRVEKNGRWVYSVSAPKTGRLQSRRTTNGSSHASARVGVLLVVQYGRNESVTLSYDDAKSLYKKLSEIFHVS